MYAMTCARVCLLLLLAAGRSATGTAQAAYTCGLPVGPQYAITATGRNSGHLLTIAVYNPAEAPCDIPAAVVLIPGTAGSQTMICRIPAARLPAGGMQQLVLRGESIAFGRPALGLNARPAPIETWILAAPVPVLAPNMPLPVGLIPVDTELHRLYLRFPGTSIPIGFLPNFEARLPAAAPLLFALHARVKSAYDTAWDAGRIRLPFARDQAYQIGLQQTMWYVFSVLENAPYTRAALRQSLLEQTERDQGLEYAAMPAAMQAYIDQSAEEIWGMIRMVARGAGVE
ncbi:MAG: hypothetical protein ACR2K1_11765 [Saprospiraceae bacterium]